MRQIVAKPWFALAGLLLVLVSGAVWIAIPKFGVWFTLLALLPWAMSWLVSNPLFQRTPFDFLVAIFLITAWVGYWAAYDKTTAWIKLWLIITAILLYYALSAQPKQNLVALSLFSFCLGLGISIYFFLTHDFSGLGSIALWWMNNRPQVVWYAIDRDYISGLLVITNLFALYWLWNIIQSLLSQSTVILKFLIILVLGIVFLAFILTMSRGTLAAVVCGLGVWILWKITTSNRFLAKLGMKPLFPVLVLVYLSAIIVFIYLGPARVDGDLDQSYYGKNTRAELFERSAYILADYPITGGGLSSFPGLYSQYVLGIPIYYFINSYNLFLDVAIEQGLIGGLAFILIYFESVWLVSRSLIKSQGHQIRVFNWLCLFALIITMVHGLIYDYLYNGNGAILLFFPVGISITGVMNLENSRDKIIRLPEALSLLHKSNARMLIIIPILGMITLFALNMNKIISIWYGNLGAVQMSQVELQSFSTNEWATSEIVPRLEIADASFRSALQYDPSNQTANYRLGLISMLRQDFESASANLETAYQEAPSHRGIIKNLGYCYVWLGNMEKAKTLLVKIPEAQKELNVYIWWWETQGRPDLSEKASVMASRLESSASQ